MLLYGVPVGEGQPNEDFELVFVPLRDLVVPVDVELVDDDTMDLFQPQRGDLLEGEILEVVLSTSFGNGLFPLRGLDDIEEVVNLAPGLSYPIRKVPLLHVFLFISARQLKSWHLKLLWRFHARSTLCKIAPDGNAARKGA